MLDHDDFSRGAFTRRAFLHRGLTLASASMAVPAFLQSSAFALPRPTGLLSSLAGVNQDRVLVVIQLSGGNDGLNTIVPFTADEYYKSRPGLAIPRDQALRLSSGDAVALHPQMAGIKSLYDEGWCGIVQGVGYPNPNRSHFKSMDIWHTADTSATGNGWLGRYFDSQCCGQGKGESGRPDPGQAPADRAQPASGPPGIAIGRTAPLAMEGQIVRPVSFEAPDLFRWTGEDVDPDLADPYHDTNRRPADAASGRETNADFLVRTALDAQISSDAIRAAVKLRPLAQYPQGPLAQQLAMVAAMIRAGLPTRVYYVSHGGFDTHAGQGAANGTHAQLLRQFAEAVRAFYNDLKAQENHGRVLTMSFSEFGRRVAQNASGGTDHGTAAPMLFFGPMVRPGVIGDHPSLSDLDSGDLKHLLDFRSVYAGVLDGWLGADPDAVLEGRYRVLPVVRKA